MHLIFLFILLRKLLESFSLVPQGPENLHQGQRLLGGSSHMANTLGGKDPPADGQCLGSSSSLWAVLNSLGFSWQERLDLPQVDPRQQGGSCTPHERISGYGVE